MFEEITTEVISDCLSANKTLNFTVGGNITHVVFSQNSNTSDDRNGEVIRRNISSLHADHGVNRNKDEAQECRLQSTATEKRFTHVMFVEQTCTHSNKVVLRGKRMLVAGNFSTLALIVGLVVKRPPRERKIPGSIPACAGIFSGSSHTSDSKIS